MGRTIAAPHGQAVTQPSMWSHSEAAQCLPLAGTPAHHHNVLICTHGCYQAHSCSHPDQTQSCWPVVCRLTLTTV